MSFVGIGVPTMADIYTGIQVVSTLGRRTPSHMAVASDALIASEMATMDWERVAVQQQ